MPDSILNDISQKIASDQLAALDLEIIKNSGFILFDHSISKHDLQSRTLKASNLNFKVALIVQSPSMSQIMLKTDEMLIQNCTPWLSS